MAESAAPRRDRRASAFGGVTDMARSATHNTIGMATKGVTGGFKGAGRVATSGVKGAGRVATSGVRGSVNVAKTGVKGATSIAKTGVKGSLNVTKQGIQGATGITKAAAKGGLKGVTTAGKASLNVTKGATKQTFNVAKGATKQTLKVGAFATKQTFNVAQGTVNIGLTAGLAATKGTVNIATGAVTAVGGTALDFATGTLDVVTGLVQNKHKRPGLRRIDSRLAWDSRVTAPYIKLDLFIECVRLPKKDSFSQADAFCGLWEAPPGFSTEKRVSKLPLKQEKEIGRTEVVRANKNPRFETAFRLEYKFQEEQTYVIRVYDEDLRYATDLKEHDFVGGCVFTLGELMGAGGCAIARPLNRGKAFVVLLGQEIVETREVLEFRFSGQDLGLLERKHKAVLTKDVLESVQKLGKKVTKEMLENMQKVNIAKNVLDKFNPFFRLEKLNPEDQSWIVVWKSEVIKDNNNPTWNSARLPLQLLCDDDPNSPLKITLWVWNRFAPEELVGYVETTVCELVMKSKGGIPVFGVMKEKKKIFGGTKLKKAGSLKVLKSSVVQVPSMLQFFSGGCEMDLMVAVDCTSFVNGADWRDDKNLHYRSHTWLNDYQAAIKKVGTIFQAYEGEREFTMFGFGAKIRGIWQPSFLLGEKLQGADGLLRAYDETFAVDNEDLEMSMAGQLSNIVQAAMYRAIHKNQERQCYSTLVILSTGVIDDVRGTMDAICAAAEDAPLSIVIIGIGNGDFSKVLTLTGAEVGKLRHSNGVPIARDCVHFVRLSEFHGNASRCVSESLSSVPEQFVQYFLNSGMPPQPAKQLPDFARQDLKDFKKMRSKKQRIEVPIEVDDDQSATSSISR